MTKFDLLLRVLEEGPEDGLPGTRTLLAEVLRRAYVAGLREGLKVAEDGVCWLTRLPDTRRQRETREWMEKAIAKAKAEGGIE